MAPCAPLTPTAAWQLGCSLSGHDPHLPSTSHPAATTTPAQAMPLPVGRLYFSDCSPLIAPALSARIYAALKKGGFLDAKDLISRAWWQHSCPIAAPHAAPLLRACLPATWERASRRPSHRRRSHVLTQPLPATPQTARRGLEKQRVGRLPGMDEQRHARSAAPRGGECDHDATFGRAGGRW